MNGSDFSCATWSEWQASHVLNAGVAAKSFVCCLAMAHGAFDTVGGMRAGFPLIVDHLVAAGTGIPGWNQPMHNMLGLLLLSHARLDGKKQNEKSQQGETEHAGTETIHGQIS